jgi:hypothetical protein
MSSSEVTTKEKKTKKFANWRELPLEIKIMDFTILAWLAIIIVDAVFILGKIGWNIRVLATVFLPVFMLIITIALRLQLVEKPENQRKIFVTWLVVFIFTIILSVLVMILYPPIIGLK